MRQKHVLCNMYCVTVTAQISSYIVIYSVGEKKNFYYEILILIMPRGAKPRYTDQQILDAYDRYLKKEDPNEIAKSLGIARKNLYENFSRRGLRYNADAVVERENKVDIQYTPAEMPTFDYTNVEFVPFPKIARLKRESCLTEKIDGTNCGIIIADDSRVYCQSRNRIITPQSDNFGFANWVYTHKDELATQLGPGIHFGEWWGSGIQRGYGLKEKRFSLFNTYRWHTSTADCRCIEAPLCYVVPILAVIEKFDTTIIDEVMQKLKASGSIAAPGFMNPEGIVIFHSQNQALYKVTYEYDEGKWTQNKE